MKKNKLQKVETKLSLLDLAKRINEREPQIELAKNEAIYRCALSVKGVADQGDDLILAKSQLKHGEWLPWLKSNCPAISHDTASRYVRVANFARAKNLDNAGTIRQAYIICGLLPETENNQPENRGIGKIETWQAPINRMAQMFSVDRLKNFDAEARQSIKSQLRDLLDRLEKFDATIEV